MKKIEITKLDTRYRGHATLTVGIVGYTTKETEVETAQFAAKNTEEAVTRIRFAASKLGYEGSDPIFVWVPNTNFKYVQD